MIAVAASRFPLRTLQAWFPPDLASATNLLADAPLVDVMQCSAGLADQLAPWAWRIREFKTMLIDLSRPEGELWERLEKKTCRYQLRKAEKLGPTFHHQEREAEARALIGGFFARKGFRRALGDAEWARLRRDAELFVAVHDGRAVAAHVVLVAPGERARALISATVDRDDSAGRALAGCCNRWLHWQEFKHFRARGLPVYDFGGLIGDPQHPNWPIDQFKLMFGGEVVSERTARLSRGPLLRAALRAAAALRHRRAPRAVLAETSHGLA